MRRGKANRGGKGKKSEEPHPDTPSEEETPAPAQEPPNTSEAPSLARAERAPRGTAGRSVRAPAPERRRTPDQDHLSPSHQRPDPQERLRFPGGCTARAPSSRLTKPPGERQGPFNFRNFTANLDVKFTNLPQNVDLLEWAGLNPADFGIGPDRAVPGTSGVGRSRAAPEVSEDEADSTEDMIMNFYDCLKEEGRNKNDAVKQIAQTLKLKVQRVRRIVTERLKQTSDKGSEEEEEKGESSPSSKGKRK